jgi:hypothetical protein
MAKSYFNIDVPVSDDVHFFLKRNYQTQERFQDSVFSNKIVDLLSEKGSYNTCGNPTVYENKITVPIPQYIDRYYRTTLTNDKALRFNEFVINYIKEFIRLYVMANSGKCQIKQSIKEALTMLNINDENHFSMDRMVKDIYRFRKRHNLTYIVRIIVLSILIL